METIKEKLNELHDLKRKAYTDFFKEKRTESSSEKLDEMKEKINSINTEMAEIKKNMNTNDDNELDEFTKNLLQGNADKQVSQHKNALLGSLADTLKNAVGEKANANLKKVEDRLDFLNQMKTIIETKDEMKIKEFKEKYNVSADDIVEILKRETKMIDEQITAYKHVVKESRYKGVTALSEIMRELIENPSFREKVISIVPNLYSRYINEVNKNATKNARAMKNQYANIIANFKISEEIEKFIGNDIKSLRDYKNKESIPELCEVFLHEELIERGMKTDTLVNRMNAMLILLNRVFIIYYKRILLSNKVDIAFRQKFMDIFVIKERYEERIVFYNLVIRYLNETYKIF